MKKNGIILSAALIGVLSTGCTSKEDVYRLDMKLEALNSAMLEHQARIEDTERCCKRNQEGMDRLYQKLMGK